jgi:hypothetical protein
MERACLSSNNAHMSAIRFCTATGLFHRIEARGNSGAEKMTYLWTLCSYKGCRKIYEAMRDLHVRVCLGIPENIESTKS